MEKSSFFFKISAEERAVRDRIFEIFECGVLSEKFCFECCGTSHLRIKKIAGQTSEVLHSFHTASSSRRYAVNVGYSSVCSKYSSIT